MHDTVLPIFVFIHKASLSKEIAWEELHDSVLSIHLFAVYLLFMLLEAENQKSAVVDFSHCALSVRWVTVRKAFPQLVLCPVCKSEKASLSGFAL